MNIINLRSKVFFLFSCFFCAFLITLGLSLLNNQVILNQTLNYIAQIKNISLETTVNGISKQQTWSAIIISYAKKFITFGALGLIFCFLAAWASKDRISKLLSRKIFGSLPNSSKYILSLVVLLFIFFFVFFISYYQQPIGDDVLYQSTYGYRVYYGGNNYEVELGEQITNVRLWMESIQGLYNYHSGRMVGHALIPLLSIFGQAFTAIMTGLCFIALILLAAAITFGSFRESLKHTAILLLIFLIIFYFNPGVGILLMWTMVSIYIVPLILLCYYYYLFQYKLHYGKGRLSILAIILFNALGFFAGFNHEVYSLVFLSFVVFLTIKEVLLNKIPLNRMFYHTGLLIGTLVCITARGNFFRLHHCSHSMIRMAKPYLSRLFAVVGTNMRMLLGIEYSSIIIISIVLLFMGLSYRYIYGNRASIKNFIKLLDPGFFIKINAVDICFLLYLIVVWSLFPYIGLQGTLLFILWLTIIILKNAAVYWIDKDKNLLLRIENSYIGASLLIIVLFSASILNFNWMQSMIKTTIERNYLIREAIKENRSTVEVPLYEEICSNRFTFNNYNNFAGGNNENESIYYKKYFGVIMYPKKQVK